MKFHHVGYAVRSIESYLQEFMVPLFQPVSVSEPVTDSVQRVTVCFVEMQGGAIIELVEPVGVGSPVDQIVGSKRGGIYHLCYEVENLDEELKRFRAKRCIPLGPPVAAAAFGDRRIVFLITPQRDLIELVESP